MPSRAVEKLPAHPKLVYRHIGAGYTPAPGSGAPGEDILSLPTARVTVRNVNTKINLKPGIYLGAAVSAALLLLPYVKLLFVPAYVLGPLIAVWFTLRRSAARIGYTDAAQLGFYSTFYGTIAAIAVDRLAGRFFHEQLWRLENIYRIPPLLAGKGLESDSPSGWYALMGLIALTAIFAGALGAPSGMLGAKLFQRSQQP